LELKPRGFAPGKPDRFIGPAFMTNQSFLVERITTPTGPMSIVTQPDGILCAVEWEDNDTRMHRLLARYRGAGFELREASHASTAGQALAAYFDGDFEAIEDLPVAPMGTHFQREVWTGLRSIPVGTAISYKTLAERIGRPKAVRAVGLANGANPVSIIVPCHRVIGADASLTGYGGGLERKRWLLAHEQAASRK
jgi:methylated-DNA-[protein]-cysteine S-methyltransferase